MNGIDKKIQYSLKVFGGRQDTDIYVYGKGFGQQQGKKTTGRRFFKTSFQILR